MGTPKYRFLDPPQVVIPRLGANFPVPQFPHVSQGGCTRTNLGGSWQPLLCKQWEVHGVPWTPVLFQKAYVTELVKFEDQRPGEDRGPRPLSSCFARPVPWLPSFLRYHIYSQPRSVVSLWNIYSCDSDSEDHSTSVVWSISVRAESGGGI